jgi:hypothetical protein
MYYNFYCLQIEMAIENFKMEVDVQIRVLKCLKKMIVFVLCLMT